MWSGLKRLFGRTSPAGAAIPPRSPVPVPLQSMADLDALIDRCGLAPARTLILSRATPCFHMIAGGPAADSPLGATRLGGAPDLPVGSAWPSSEHGVCGFLGQFDLADVRHRTGAADLPPEGLLSVFVDFIDSAADPVPVRAILTPPGVPLERLTPPRSQDDYGPYTGWLNPVGVSAFVPGINVPAFDFRLYSQIEALAPDGDTDAFQDALSSRPAGAVGQLLGQGFDHDGPDLRLAIHARQIGRPRLADYDFIESWEEWERLKTIRNRMQNGQIHRPWSDAGDDDVRFMLANRARLAAAADDVRLLLMIESNRPMGLLINDADPIFVFVPAGRLAAGDMSELYGAVTQG